MIDDELPVLERDVLMDTIDTLTGALAEAANAIVRLSQRVADLEEELAWTLNTARERL